MNSSYIQSFDGTVLYLEKEVPKEAKAIVLIVHGLCEHGGRYDYVAEKLKDSNFGVYRFDHRGHARSEGKKIFYSDFNEITDDVNHVVELIKKEYPEHPLFLLGHSMGGFAVTSFGTKYPGKVDGFVTSGALTRDNMGILESVPTDLDVNTYFPNQLGDGVCSDPQVVADYAVDPLVGKEISAGLFYSLKKGIKWLKTNHENFVDPIFVMHGANDGLVSEKDSRDFFGDIKSKDKALKIYPFLMHEILNEKCKDEIIEEFKNWIEKRL